MPSKIETYDRTLEVEASALATMAHSPSKDRDTFAKKILSNAKEMADYMVDQSNGDFPARAVA